MTPRGLSGRRDGVIRVILFVLLLANTLMELAGGTMMIAQPEKVAAETFGLFILPEGASFMAVIGGATLSYALVSGTAAAGVIQGRAWARVPVILLGAMLAAVGVVMIAHGMGIGRLDLAKGVIFVAGGIAYQAGVPSAVRA